MHKSYNNLTQGNSVAAAAVVVPGVFRVEKSL